MLFYKVVTLFNAVTTFFLGFFVYFKNKRSLLNRIFFIFCLSIALWAIFYFFWLVFNNTKTLALFFARVLNIVAVFIPITYFHFVTLFLSNYKEKKKLVILGYFITFFIFLSGFTKFFVKDVAPRLSFSWYPQPGFFYHFFVITFVGFVLYSWVLIFKSLQKFSGLKKLQAKYLLIGTIIGFAGGFTSFFPVYNVPIFPYGTGLVIFSVVFITFAILKYHLFEIRIILTELLVGTMGIILLVLPFLMPTRNLKFVTSFLFILFLIFGYYLIKATHEEEKRREEAERVAERERKLRLEVERLNEARNQFLLSAQHYFRTPLTSIIGYLSMILDGAYGPLDPVLKEKLSFTFSSCQELHKRIEEGLTIASFQSGKGILNLEEIQFEDFLKEIFSEVEIQAKTKGLEFKLDLPKTPLPKIKIDVQRMREAISNLIQNAIKHTKEGGVYISLERKNNTLLLKIKDTGIGIPKEELPHLGTIPFERGRESKKLSPLGRGIGLYLSRLIIETHGGKLKIESEGIGKGTTVYVELNLVGRATF